MSVARWSDIWLNEGFATWAEWNWIEHTGGPTTARTLRDLMRIRPGDRRFWRPAPGDPGAKHMFDETVYVRGAMTLEALRQKVGTDVFFSIIRRWTAEHRYGNATIPDFIATAESVSGVAARRVLSHLALRPREAEGLVAGFGGRCRISHPRRRVEAPPAMTTISTDAIATKSFDHVALWVSDRGPLTELLCERLGLHVIDSTDDFTLVGADAREGKLTLFEAEGARDRGLLERVTLRVNDLDDAMSRLGDDFDVERDGSTATLRGPGGPRARAGRVRRARLRPRRRRAARRRPRARRARARRARLRAARRPPRDRESHARAGPGRPRRLGASAAQPPRDARRLGRGRSAGSPSERGIEVEKTVDAENTIAVFLRGPERILLEYVEHKPGFSLT